jgi:hypothetical protein
VAPAIAPIRQVAATSEANLEEREAVGKWRLLGAQQVDHFAGRGGDGGATVGCVKYHCNSRSTGGTERAVRGFFHIDNVGPAGQCGERFVRVANANQEARAMM